MKSFGFKFLCAAAVLAAAPMCFAAISVDFDPDGGAVGNGTLAVGTMDWAPGNSLSIGGATAIASFLGAPLPPTSQVTYQSRLAGLSDINSLPIIFSGLGTAYELTAVAAFQEVVSGFSGVPGGLFSTAVLSVVGGGDNYFEIFYDPAVNSNQLQGTGFNDGTLVLRASVVNGNTSFTATGNLPIPLDNFGTNDYDAGLTAGVADASTNQLALSGIGNTTINAVVSYTNPAFFPTPPPVGFMLTMNFTTTVNTPFGQVDPSARFIWSAGGPALTTSVGTAPIPLGAGLGSPSGAGSFVPGSGIGARNGDAIAPGRGGPDVQFQADANNSFDLAPIPEPTSVLVWGLMAVAVGAGARFRRRRKMS